jgi:methionine-rich copper-binding protein CopC
MTLEVDVMKRVLNVLLVVVLMAAVSTAPSGATQIDGPGYPSGTEAKLACTATYMGLDAAADLPRTSVAIVHFFLSISGDINTSAAGTLGSIDTTGTTYATDWGDDELANADIVATHYGVTRNEAIAFSTGLIIFLAALDGACTGDTVAAPGAPATLNAADANSAALTVTWTAPATDGGAAVTTYTASATDGTDTFTCTSSGLSCQVKGLDYDTDYTVTVTAENTAGPGPIKQTLIRTATDPSLSCTTGQVAKWDGTAWACATDIDTNTGGDYSESGYASSAVTWAQSNGLTTASPDGAVTRGEVLTILQRYNNALAGNYATPMSKQPMSAATSGECSEDEYFAGLNTDTIALDCEPVKVIYNETTVTVTDADVPSTGLASWTGECPASHPIVGSGTMFYPSTNEAGRENRPPLMQNAPFSVISGERKDKFSMSLYGSYDPFSITVTFMTQCWTAPSTYGDTTNPTLVSASPADNETAVVAGKSIVLNFSEKVDAETGNVTIYQTSDSAVVEAIDVSGSQVTGSGTSTITVNPTDDLAYSAEYYVLIDATAFDDASSNSYAGISDTSALSFTTATTPSAPWEFIATNAVGYSLAAGEILLFWRPPSSTGGAAVSDFLIEYSTDGTTWTTYNHGRTSWTIYEQMQIDIRATGLANSTTYTFRISAINAAGTGPASATASATTHTLPDAPTGLSAECMNEGVIISWTQPVGNGGATITDYVVEYSTDSGVTWTTAESMGWPPIDIYPRLVTGLVNGTAYLLRVAAVNGIGTGNFSDNLSITARGPGSPPDCPS